MSNHNDKPIIGVGLVLSRFRGQRILIKAKDEISDAEILKAIRNEGIVLTMVDMYDFKHPQHKSTRRVAKIGIRASSHLAIVREEIINQERPQKGSSDAGVQAQE